MIEKVNLKHLLAIGAIGLAINFLFLGCGKSKTIGELQTNTDRTMGTIKAESAGVAVEVSRSKNAGINAQKSIGRINCEINDYRGRVNDFRAGINELERQLAECERLARENSKIIAGIDEAN